MKGFLDLFEVRQKDKGAKAVIDGRERSGAEVEELRNVEDKGEREKVKKEGGA